MGGCLWKAQFISIDMSKAHLYKATITWTGNKGTGTSEYRAYDRDHVISAAGKPEIPGSADPAFRGNKTRYNPEDTLVASVSACHMLWYLHLCADNKIVVEKYVDYAEGSMIENEDGSGQFKEITLRPVITVQKPAMREKAISLHHEANKMCFIARSVNFPIHHEPEILVSGNN
jgi:organic hydroperoxide reductase OsmC/OhrA